MTFTAAIRQHWPEFADEPMPSGEEAPFRAALETFLGPRTATMTEAETQLAWHVGGAMWLASAEHGAVIRGLEVRSHLDEADAVGEVR